MCYEKIKCPSCSSEKIVKNGHRKNDKQNYLCKSCRKQFIADYTYNGCKPFVKSLIIPMTLNSSGIRDIARVLKISTNTVISAIKKEASRQSEPSFTFEGTDKRDVEIDEMWSFVEKKENQQWLWYAYSRQDKKVLAFVSDKRTDKACKKLITKLSNYPIDKYFTDNWSSYAKYLPEDKHFISKIETQRIERNNLTLRTRVKRFHRKTICFSKTSEMHENVLKIYFNHMNLFDSS